MKKLLVFLVMFGVLLGVSGVVMGFDGTVTVEDETIEFTLSPDPSLNFGTVVAGGPAVSAVNGPITFDVTSGNVDVTLEVTDIVGDTILDGIEVRDTGTEDLFASIIGKSDTVLCAEVDNSCTYAVGLSWDAQLQIPLGTPSDIYNAAITYTINGAAP